MSVSGVVLELRMLVRLRSDRSAVSAICGRARLLAEFRKRAWTYKKPDG